MRALADQDHPVLERWAGMADAETAVVQDVHLGGFPVCLLGIESRPVPRLGFPPTDGPDTYTAGTLFPQSSKKAARAINAASGNRPLVVLANLSGFDGSPESMRKLQLEYGAEIGRAIVNFVGPIVFCVISRYHGGAFVVFSKALNPNMTVLASRARSRRSSAARRRRRWCSPATSTPAPANDPRVKRRWSRASPRRPAPSGPRWPPSSPSCGRGPGREARRGGRRVRRRAQHPARGRGRLGGRHHQRRRAAAADHRGDRAGPRPAVLTGSGGRMPAPFRCGCPASQSAM